MRKSVFVAAAMLSFCSLTPSISQAAPVAGLEYHHSHDEY
ncbi:hypothetical protein BIWAKO_06705 [Bosea sp. BIWAKO-01]|nr:hypothetical protein BIWAKO_06705 [Bosea sp. BIWAKO-01]